MYKFRFEFIDNIRGVTAGINRQFASMRAAAKSFMDSINANNGAAGLKRMADASMNFFNPERVQAFGRQFVDMNDELMRSEGLILAITGSNKALSEARSMALDLQKSIGVSVIDATKGLAQMLPLAKGNLKEAAKLTTLAAGLGALNKDEGFAGAAFALKELESGDALSLRERFNIRVPDKKEAEAIAKRDGKTVQQVLFDALNNHLDKTYGQGQKGQGVKTLLQIDQNTIGGQMKLITASITSALTPIIMDIGPKVQSFFSGLAIWINENREAVQRFVPPILAVIGAFAGFAAIGSIISGITAAVSSFGVVLGVLTSPVTLVVAGVAALAVGVVYLWNRFEEFRGALVAYFYVLREVGRIIFEYVSPAFKGIKDWFVSIGPSIRNFAKAVFDYVIWPFKMIAKVLSSIFSFAVKQASSASPDIKKISERIGGAAMEGYRKGVKSKQINLFGPGKKDENSLYSKLGIKEGAPGALGGSGKQTKADGSISGEGTGSGKNVYININKLVESITIQSSNLADSASRIKEEVARALLSAVNDYNYAN